MAHKEQNQYILKIKDKFPHVFNNQRVLNIGSFIVNGDDESQYFTNCETIGLDIGPGKGVDVVCSAHKYDADDGYFDVIISCECWEHNPFYRESILNAIRMLRVGGFFIFTCATTGRPVHGTPKQDAVDVARGKTSQGNAITNWVTMPNVIRKNWDNAYYQNVEESDIRNFLDVDKVFSRYAFETNKEHCDLYFWGFKK